MNEQITSPALEMLMKQDTAFLERATTDGFLTVDEATRCREIQLEVLNSTSRYERVNRIVMTEGLLSADEIKTIEQKLLAMEIDGGTVPQDAPGKKGEEKEEIADRPEDLGVMIVIEEGPFIARTFTAAEGDRAETIHVKRYAIDRYPVTNKEFEQFLHQTGGLIPQHWVGGKIPVGKEYHPVTGISWHDATRYAEWCGKRLPTKWEWEKAAGGLDGFSYCWGNPFKAEACHSLLAPMRGTMPIHSHPEGVSPYGCLDMCGNVWEWTNDTVTRVEEETVESFRIIKGGSFYCGPLGLRVGAYSKAYDRMKDADLGFRCVMDVAVGVGPVIMPTKPGDAISEAEAARRAEAFKLPEQIPAPVSVQPDSRTLAATTAYPSLHAPTAGSSRQTVVASDSGGLGGLGDTGSSVHSSPTIAMSPSDSGSGSSQTAISDMDTIAMQTSDSASGISEEDISGMETIAMSPQEAAGGSDVIGTREAMGIFDGLGGGAGATPAAPAPVEPPMPEPMEQDVFGAETMEIPGAEAQADIQQAAADSEVVDLQFGAAGQDATQQQPQPGYDQQPQAGQEAYQQPPAGQEAYQQPQAGFGDFGQQQPDAGASGADIFGDETMAIPGAGAQPGQGGMDAWDQPLTEKDTQEIPIEPGDGVVDLSAPQASDLETQEMPQMQENAWGAATPGENADIYGSETMAIPPSPDDGSGAPIDLQPSVPPVGYGTEEQTGAMPPGEDDIFGSETIAIPPRPDDGSGAPIDLQPKPPEGEPETGEPPAWGTETQPPPE